MQRSTEKFIELDIVKIGFLKELFELDITIKVLLITMLFDEAISCGALWTKLFQKALFAPVYEAIHYDALRTTYLW